jgi:hypothetical protein
MRLSRKGFTSEGMWTSYSNANPRVPAIPHKTIDQNSKAAADRTDVLSPHKKGSPIAEMLIPATLPTGAYGGPFYRVTKPALVPCENCKSMRQCVL